MAKSHYKDKFEIITSCSLVASKLHGVTSQKVAIIVTTARTSNLIKMKLSTTSRQCKDRIGLNSRRKVEVSSQLRPSPDLPLARQSTVAIVEECSGPWILGGRCELKEKNVRRRESNCGPPAFYLSAQSVKLIYIWNRLQRFWSPKRPDRLWGAPNFLFGDYQGIFPQRYCDRGLKDTSRFHRRHNFSRSEVDCLENT